MKLFENADFDEMWRTLNAQRILGMGIASLAFAPLVTNAYSLWNGNHSDKFLAALALLGASIVSAQVSLVAHRKFATSTAIYASLRRKKEGALQLAREQGMNADWRDYLDELNSEDKELADDAGLHYKALLQWLGLQYLLALLGVAAMVWAMALTPTS